MKFIVFIIFLSLLCSCHSHRTGYEDVLSAIVGKEVAFSDSLRKSIFAAMVAVTLATCTYIGASSLSKGSNSDDFGLANAEALANDESSTECRWQRVVDSHGCWYHECTEKGNGNTCSCKSIDL